MPRRSSPHTAEEVLQCLLGCRPGFSVEALGSTYVLPEGQDPYWTSFMTFMGYELLEVDERPAIVTPPGERTHCVENPNRKSWISDKPYVEPVKPRIRWSALGDLRGHIQRIAHNLRTSDSGGRLEWVAPAEDTSKQQQLYEASQKLDDILERERETCNLYMDVYDLLGMSPDPACATIANTNIHRTISHAISKQAQRLRAARAVKRHKVEVGAAGLPPPRYPEKGIGKPSAALRVVHVAFYYLCGVTRDPLPGPQRIRRACLEAAIGKALSITGKDLAMIVALDTENGNHVFGAGAQYLDNTNAGRDASRRYWKELIRTYRGAKGSVFG